VTHALEDSFECSPVEFFVVDDEDVGFLQGGLRMAEGARPA
jgi:hypothetical protein